MSKLIKPLLEYNKTNIRLISNLILKNLTPDLLPKKYHEQNKVSKLYGHCHNASGCFYMIFRSKNVHMFRAFDAITSKKLGENFYHWWIVDKNNNIIDLTASQYSQSHVKKLYKLGEKGSILGFNYKNRVRTVYEKVTNNLKQAKNIK
jgi:hypothetical protein